MKDAAGKGGGVLLSFNGLRAGGAFPPLDVRAPPLLLLLSFLIFDLLSLL
jgi:hypothetical protein